MKLAIENKTDLNGRDLRSLFTRIAREWGVTRATLTVTGARQSHPTVRAGRSSIRLRIPKGAVDVTKVAQALAWGCAFVAGGRDAAPENPWIMAVEVDGIELRRKVPLQPKSKAERAALASEGRERKAKAKVKELTTKIKRLRTQLSKWQAKVDYYERKRRSEAEQRSPAYWAKLARDAEAELRYSEAAGHWLAAAGCSPTEKRRDEYETKAERCLKKLDARRRAKAQSKGVERSLLRVA